jgi:hypothetical protein
MKAVPRGFGGRAVVASVARIRSSSAQGTGHVESCVIGLVPRNGMIKSLRPQS